jgi:hypothetical protein
LPLLPSRPPSISWCRSSSSSCFCLGFHGAWRLLLLLSMISGWRAARQPFASAPTSIHLHRVAVARTVNPGVWLTGVVEILVPHLAGAPGSTSRISDPTVGRRWWFLRSPARRIRWCIFDSLGHSYDTNKYSAYRPCGVHDGASPKMIDPGKIKNILY